MLSAKDIICRMYCGILVIIWILAPYAILQHVEIREVFWMSPMAIDQAIAVNFSSIWFYLSFYLLLAIVGLTVEKRLFIRYLYTIGWGVLVAHMIFLFFPNGVSRNEIDIESAPKVYQLLVSLDQPRHAFPSLHAMLSVIAGLAVQSSQMKCVSTAQRVLLKIATWLWVVAIFWSTIALRQHVLLDLISATIIAIVVWKWMKNSWEMNHHFSSEPRD